MAMTGGTAKLVSQGTPPGWPGPISLYVYYKEKSQSIENNKTVLSLGMYIDMPARHYIGSWGDFYGSYIGTATSGDNCKTFDGKLYSNTYGPYWLVEDQEITVTHDDDGEKTVTIYWKWGVNSGWSGVMNIPSGSFNVQLTTIPRASGITSAANVTLGKNCSIKWKPHSASFRYKLKFSLGDWSHTTGAIHPNTTADYTYTGYEIPVSVAKQIPSAKTGTMTVKLYTYSDSDATKQVGDTASDTFTVTVPTLKPDVTMQLTPVSDLPAAFAGLYIQGKSQVKATLTAAGQYGTEIKSYSMKVDGKTYDAGDQYTSGYLTNAGSITVKGYATDNRGYTGETEENITVIAYSKPQIRPASGESEVLAVRCDRDGIPSDSGTYLKIKAKRSYSPVKSGSVQKNFCKIRYRYKVDGGSWSAWATILEGSSLNSDEAETGALLGGTLSAKSSYIVQVGVIDDLGGSNATTIPVPTDKVYWHRDGRRRSLTFGGYVEDDNTFAIAEDITFETKGPLMARGGGNVDILILGKQLTASADARISLNNYKTPGNYYSPNAENSRYISDSPYTAGGFALTVRELQTTSYIRQELFYGRTTWIRHFDGTVWSDWWRYQTTTVPETASADYVIETGTSGGWTYRKWKGGTYEMFGTFEITPTSSSKNEALYRTNNMTIAVPFDISSAYVTGTVVGYYWITNGGISGDSAITLRLMSDKEFNTTNAIEVRLTVVGTYD